MPYLRRFFASRQSAFPGRRMSGIAATGHCKHYLKSKHKFCAWPVVAEGLCGHHRLVGRVPCPVDGTHTVATAELAAHVLVCTAARQAAEAFAALHIRAGVNAGSNEEGDDAEAHAAEAASLWRLRCEDERFADACARVRRVASLVLAAVAQLPRPTSTPAVLPTCVAEALSRAAEAAALPHSTSPYDAKHAQQQAAILAAMHAVRLLPPREDTVYAELGAGRGYLLHTLAESYGACRLLFVERRSYRCKAERSLRRRQGVQVARLRCDVADLQLDAAVRSLDGQSRRVVAVAKHLCGSGTDVALRAAARSGALAGVAVAGCCHHACTWRAFVNKPMLRAAGLGPREFAVAARLASWSVDSHGGAPAGCDVAAASRWGLSAQERAEVGAAVKLLFDQARAQWIADQCGAPASLVYYVDRELTPENRLIVMACGQGA